MNPFDDFTRDLARCGESLALPDVLAQLDERTVRAWLDSQLAESDPSDIVLELAEEMRRMNGDRVDRTQLALRITLDALTKDDPQAVVWYALADALRRCVARAAIRKATSLLWIDDVTRPIREAVDHYDAIGADRRALAREVNRAR